MQVLPSPYWTGNPYLPRFCREIEERGVAVVRRKVRCVGLAALRRGDWVHFHWPGALLMSRYRWLYAWRVRRFEHLLRRLRGRGLRLAWTAHNLLPHDDRHPDLARRGRRALLAHVDHVFAHFPSAADALATEFGYRGPITVLPHGNYLDDYGALADPAEARRALGLPDQGLVILLLGLLRPYKGIAQAIRAFQLAAGAGDRLIIAGRRDGDIAGELALATGDPRIVVRDSHVPSSEIARYHAAADAFLIAHRATFTSGSAVMALSLGCPIIGPAQHHLASLGPEPNLFAAADISEEGLAAAIQRRRAYGPVDRAAIREWARVHLSWDEAGARAAAVFLAPVAT